MSIHIEYMYSTKAETRENRAFFGEGERNQLDGNAIIDM